MPRTILLCPISNSFATGTYGSQTPGVLHTPSAGCIQCSKTLYNVPPSFSLKTWIFQIPTCQDFHNINWIKYRSMASEIMRARRKCVMEKKDFQCHDRNLLCIVSLFPSSKASPYSSTYSKALYFYTQQSRTQNPHKPFESIMQPYVVCIHESLHLAEFVFFVNTCLSSMSLIIFHCSMPDERREGKNRDYSSFLSSFTNMIF